MPSSFGTSIFLAIALLLLPPFLPSIGYRYGWVTATPTVVAAESSNPREKYDDEDDRDDFHDFERKEEGGRQQQQSNKKQRKVSFYYVPLHNPKYDYGEDGFKERVRDGISNIMDDYWGSVNHFIQNIKSKETMTRQSELIIWPDDDYSNYDSGNKHNAEISPGPFSASFINRIPIVVETMESDGDTLEKLLIPFDAERVSPSYPFPPPPHIRAWWNGKVNRNEGDNDDNESDDDCLFPRNSGDSDAAYNDWSNVILHVQRDWTESGKGIRASLYDWCVEQLVPLLSVSSPLLPVLVPGAGAGRLVHEISAAGFDVEANEISETMSAIAYRFLNNDGNAVEPGVLHPYLFSIDQDEVDASMRFDPVTFPDNKIRGFLQSQSSPVWGSLSYTIGDFVEIYSKNAKKKRYSSIVTCFFIDTATNIYEYLLAIRNILEVGGTWINVGPLHWHENAMIRPSADELRPMIERMGFEIKSWGVDLEKVSYQSDTYNNHDDGSENQSRRTKVWAYHPLRFVVVRTKTSDDDQDVYRSVAEMRRRLDSDRYRDCSNPN